MNAKPAMVEELLERRLRAAGLSEFVDRSQSQFLELQDELFVEVVLTEGIALDDAERIIRYTAQELKNEGITLDGVVRALWEIVEVSYVGPSRAPDGGLRAALEFRAVLRSGRRDCPVTVNVFWGAMEFLERKLDLRGFADPQGTPRQGHLDAELLSQMVRRFLQHQLSFGGTSSWNPLLDSRLELNEAAMSFLYGQSTVFEELRQAISDAFEPPVLDSFMNSLSLSEIKIGDFNSVLPGLSSMLGGAYRRGETFSTSANELFQKLQRTEQELLKKYYFGKVEQLRAEDRLTGLARKFPKVFS